MKATPNQPSLPGIDVQEIRLKELLKNNPVPTTVEQAEAFFRARTTTQLILKKDHDSLRIVLKNSDVNEDDMKHEKKVELPLDDRDEWERKYIAAAAESHRQWFEVEKDKY